VRSASIAIVAALISLFTGCGGESSSPLQFVDVAAERGLDFSHSAFRWEMSMDPVAMMGGGLCWVDVDNDGWLDLFVTDTWSNGEWGQWDERGGVPTTRLFRNEEGSFVDVSEDWGADQPARANGCVAADLDGDGWVDLYVTTERENLLLWNKQGRGFVEGARAAGVEAYGWSAGVAAGDVDGDGRTDLVVAGYAALNKPVTTAETGFPNTFEAVEDIVFLNQGGSDRPTFAAEQTGLEPDGPEYGLGVLLTDFDGDNDLDLHIANDTQPNRLYRNESTPGNVRFVDQSAQSGADDPNSGMGIASTDVDSDDRPDLVVTNLAGQGHVALTSSDGAFNATETLNAVRTIGDERTGWGVSFGDFDNDGDADLLIASGAIPITDLNEASEPLTYLANEHGVFVDASDAVGIGGISPRNGRSIALADFDNDGDLDAAVSAIGQPLVLLENQQQGGSWLMVDVGAAIPGLRAHMDLTDGSSIDRLHHVGGSWLSSEDPRIHFGLPRDAEIDRLQVWAPDGMVLYDGSPDKNQVLAIGEDDR
jgi:hypothetical protein